jgi:hypothetical protein
MLGGFAAAQANLGPSGQIQVKGTLGPTLGGTGQNTYAKGDLLCGTGTNTTGKLAVGPNTDILVADSTQTCGFKWATPPAGGTVTHTIGALTANQVVIGAGSADITVLGSLGTTSTVLHGNAAGAPSFGSVVGGDMASNTVTSTQLAVVNNRRVCTLPVGDGSTTNTNGLYAPFTGPRCLIPYASTIVEVFVQSDAGTPSFQIEKRNGASTVTDILSGSLSAAGTTKVCAKTSTSATCIDGTTSSGSITISTTSISAGDILEFKNGTASTDKRTDVFVVYTVN